jgi:pentatricopeptide repeat protein
MKTMETKKVEYNLQLSTIIIKYFCSINSNTQLLQLFDEMRLKKIITPQIYNIVLTHYSENKNLNGIKDIVQRMAIDGIPVDVFTNTIILQYYIRVKNPEMVQNILKDMKKNNIEPTITTYTILCAYYLRNGKYELFDKLLADLKKSDVKPNSFFYNTILRFFFFFLFLDFICCLVI